jgi:glycerophosphoryl diester phosphodiesterase
MAMRPGLDIIAHRLGRSYGPDNSAAALERCLSGPLDGLETDVCLTADRELVLLHDPLLSLGTTLSGWAHEHTLAEIKHGLILGSDGEPTDQSPLALAELLEGAPRDLIVQAEVKTHSSPELARETAAAICNRYANTPERDRLEVISFHTEACEVAAEHGLRTRLVIWADYAPESLAGWAVTHGVSGVKVEHFMLTEPLVNLLRAAGLSVSTGTINDLELLAAVVGADPKCLTTDRPHELVGEAAAAGLIPFPLELAQAA